jgi:hypothetical protein
MRPPACEAIAEELVAYVDGEQPEPERVRIASHVAGCAPCRRELERIAKVNALVASLRPIEPSADLGERFRRRLEDEPAGAPAVHSWRPALWWVPAFAAAAATVLVWYWMLSRPASDGPGLAPGSAEIAAGPDAPERVAAPRLPPPDAAPADESRVARAPAPAPEDLPPELVERPEFFVRLPVIRRLEELEHFEEVRVEGGDGRQGAAGGPATRGRA